MLKISKKVPFACRINSLHILYMLPYALYMFIKRIKCLSISFWLPGLPEPLSLSFPLTIYLIIPETIPHHFLLAVQNAQRGANLVLYSCRKSVFIMNFYSSFTWLSIPSISNMEKNSIAHKGEIGNCVTASGYARNASPGPGGRNGRENVSLTDGVLWLFAPVDAQGLGLFEWLSRGCSIWAEISASSVFIDQVSA